jgi:hypothetical protein
LSIRNGRNRNAKQKHSHCCHYRDDFSFTHIFSPLSSTAA